MNALIDRCAEAGVRTLCDARVNALVRDDAARIVGVRVRVDGETRYLRARRGVVMAAGGFGMHPELMARFVPQLPRTADPLGIPNNDGDALLLGLAAGAATQAMSGTIATGSFYPPVDLIKGILVNRHGERFVAEDSYHGRTAERIAEQPGAAAYLIVNEAIFAYPDRMKANFRLIDGWETVPEMNWRWNCPRAPLVRTLHDYNVAAARGEDPLLHKQPEWLQPLNPGPYAAFDVSYDQVTYVYLTLGGLVTSADAEVLDDAGRPIAGFYAAGACVSSIPQNGKGYASGLSLGPGSYYGRVAGQQAAKATTNV